MDLDKFGSPILSKFKSESIEQNKIKVVQFIDLSYHITLPFIGTKESEEKYFTLINNNKQFYQFPLPYGIILSGEYSKRDFNLEINGKGGPIENRVLKKGDKITFSNFPKSKLTTYLFGELIVKSPIIIE